MSKEKEIKWLYTQLPDLVRKKVLTEESAGKLQEYFGPVNVKDNNLAFIITSVLGSLLIGAGIILMFATNWEALSRSNRTIISFLPLISGQILYAYTFFSKSESIAWKESTSAFLMLMLASTIALISQTYNLGGTLKDFILAWMLLSIPLMYLMQSSLVCMFYLLGITYWTTEAYFNDQIVWYWALLAAAIPHIVLNMRSDRPSIRSNILGWTFALTLVVATGSIAGDFGGKNMVVGIGLILVLLYLLGKILFKHGQTIWSRPFQTVALFLIAFYSLSLSYEWHLRYFYEVNDSTYYVNGILAVLVSAAILILLAYNIQKKNGINYFVVAFPFLVLLGIVLFENGNVSIPVILFNIYSLAFGIFYLWYGLKSEQIAFVNAGMFFISVLLLERFFDQDIGFLVKGIIFILIGIGFLAVNLVLMRKRKIRHAEQIN